MAKVWDCYLCTSRLSPPSTILLLHEIGHLAGWLDGYKGFDNHVQTIMALDYLSVMD